MSQDQTEPRHGEEREDNTVGAEPTAPTGASGAEPVADSEPARQCEPAADQSNSSEPDWDDLEAELRDLEPQLGDLDDPTQQPAEEPDTAELEAVREENAQLRDGLARARADHYNLTQQHNNYVRRAKADQASARTLGRGDVVEALLPVLDDIDAARAAGALEDGPFAAIAAKLEQILTQRCDFARFGEVGDAFDPTLHEAVMAVPSEDVEVETIHQVIQAGYRSGDRVVRAAKVIVANPA